MEEINASIVGAQNKGDVKAQARNLAQSTLRRVGFFGLTIAQKRHTFDVTANMLNGLIETVDMNFSTNFHLYFLRKFLQYTIEDINLNLLHADIDPDLANRSLAQRRIGG